MYAATLPPLSKQLARARILAAALCLIPVGACAERPDPLEQALDAVGGREALEDLRGFSYEATGDRFESGQGVNPEAGPSRSSSFELSVLYDIESDRLTFDWERRIVHPLQGAIAYQEIIDGDIGFQAGNNSAFNPPGTDTSRALPSEHIGAVRREFRLLNPLIYLRAAATTDGAATVKADEEEDGQTYHVIEMADATYPVELMVETGTGRVAGLRTVQYDHIWGDVGIEVSFDDWSAMEGSPLQFPRRVELAVAGETLHSENRTDVVANPGLAAFALPDEPRTQVDEAAARGGALSAHYHTRWHGLGIPADQNQTTVIATPVAGDGAVQHITGGTHHSLAVKLDDGIVVIEPPLNEARSKAVLAKLEELWPGVPVTHVILSHHHYDHMGGLRTYAAAGATIVTSALNREYVEGSLSSPHTLVIDELAKAESPAWQIEAVEPGSEFILEEGEGTLRVRHVSTVHSEDLVVVYVPATKSVFVSDAYLPAFPAGQPLPEPFSVWGASFREQLGTFGWDVELIVGGHGVIESIADFHSHFEG